MQQSPYRLPLTNKRTVFSSVLLVVVFLLATMALQAQRRGHWYVSPGVGAMYYQGDLKDNSLPSFSIMKPSLSLDVKYKRGKYYSITIGYTRGWLSGADSLGSKSGIRDFHFRTAINDFHILGRINFGDYTRSFTQRKKSWTYPGLLVGLGIVNFNPQGQLNDTWYDLQPLGTEGQNIVNGTEDYPDPYSLWQFNVKLGVETTFYLQERLELDIWAHYTFLFTDYLDDVGGQYPNRTELLGAPEGELAAQFSFRDVDGGGRRAGSDRANPDSNDGFMNFGVSASYRITEARTSPRRRYRRFIPRARF